MVYPHSHCSARRIAELPQSQIVIRDQLNPPALQHLFGFWRGQQRQFLHSRLAQPGVNLVEISIVVAGVADELPCSFRNAVHDVVNSFKSRHPVTSTASDPSVVRRPWASTSRRNLAAKLRSTFSSAKRRHNLRFRSRSTIGNGHTRPNGLRTAGNAALPRRSQQRPQHRRKHVGVLVGVEMRGPHPRRLQALDLRDRFGFDLSWVELVAERSDDEVIKLDAKLAAPFCAPGCNRLATRSAGNSGSPSSSTT